MRNMLCGGALRPAGVVVLLVGLAGLAHGEGGDNPLVFPQRAHVEVETPWMAGESVLQLGGSEVIFAPSLGLKGRFTGFIRVGSAVAPMKGKLKCKKGRWTFTAKAKDRVEGKTDLSVSLKGEIDGRDVTGKGSVVQKSTQLSVKGANLTGRAAGNFPSERIHIQFHFEPNAPAGTSPNLESFVITPGGILPLKKFICRSKPNGDGTDTVQITAKGKGVSAKFKGTNDGNEVVLTGSGKADIYKWTDADFTFPNLPAARPNAFLTGTDSKIVDIAPNGCLVTDCILTTTAGVVVTLPADSKLRTRSGALITGRVKITVDDGGGVRVFPGHTMADGSVRVVVDLLGPTGNDAVRRLYAVCSDLGVSIRLPINSSGQLRRMKRQPSSVGRSYDGFNPLGQPSPAITDTEAFATCPCTLTPFEDCTFESKLDCGDSLGGADGIDITGTTGSFTFSFDDPPVSPAPPDPGPVTDLDLPAGDDVSAYPMLKSVTVTTLDGKTVLGTASFGSPGLGLDEAGFVFGPDGQTIGAVEMVGVGGERKLRVRSPFGNLWRVVARFCDDLGDEFTLVLLDPRPDDGESSLVISYMGPVRICLRTRGDYHSELRIRISRALRAGLPDGSVLSQPLWRPPALGEDDDVFKWSLSGFDPSVRDIRDILDGEGLDVDSLAFTYTDRGIEIAPLLLVPRVIFADLANDFVQFLDLETGNVLAPEIPLGGRPDFTAMSRNGCYSYAIVRRFLYVIDAKRRVILRRIKLKGNGTGLAVDRTGSQIYVTTDKGDFQARDALDLHEIWKIDGFPAQSFLTSISVPLSGGTVWFSDPLSNKLFSVDTIRQTRGGDFQVNGIQSVAVSHSGTRLAVTKLQAGVVSFLDLETGPPFADVPSGGTLPIEPVWGLDDEQVFIGNQGTRTIGVVNALTVMFDSTVTGLDGADSLELLEFQNDLIGLSAGQLGAEIFTDGFESGNVSRWSSSESAHVSGSR